MDTANRMVVETDINLIQETPENWQIYRRPTNTEPAFVELCKSIDAQGIKTPLEISADHYILSGHRRFLAAKWNGIQRIPVIVDENITVGNMSTAERIKLLIKHNRGTRIKTDSEQYLEAAARVDPEQAVREAQQRKAEHFTKAKCSVELVGIKGKSRRTNPSEARSEMLNAVIGILDDLRQKDHLPTSSRHIHYRLLAHKVKTSSYSTGYIYGTRPGSAGLLSKLLTDARSDGTIDPDDINDETRPTQPMNHHACMASYVLRTLDGLFGNFYSDIHVDQPHYIQLLVDLPTSGSTWPRRRVTL